MKISFYTLGCKLNYSETSQLQGQFEALGHEVVPFGEHADAVVINTCTVTENADKECRQIIRRALRTSPEAFVAVTGCYAQLQPEEIASVDGVDAVFGAKEKFRITELVDSYHKYDTPRIFVSDLSDGVDFVESQSRENDTRTRAFLKIQDGCNYKCSFCTIPQARGASRSMPFDTVLQRVKDLEIAGYHEITLSGINLGDYKAADGSRFEEVVRAVSAARPDVRLRIGSIEPNLLTQNIIDAVAEYRVFCPHFHIPLQSGSPEILRLMRRRYTADHYRDLVLRIKESMPEACIGADVIVGFPGESDEHFEQTYDFLNSLPVSYLHVFTYSERENTPAASFSDVVPQERRKIRTARLRALSAAKRREFNKTAVGRTVAVIPESKNPITGMWEGWSAEYVRVAFPYDGSLVQTPVEVLIDGLHPTDDDKVVGTFVGHAKTAKTGYIPLMV